MAGSRLIKLPKKIAIVSNVQQLSCIRVYDKKSGFPCTSFSLLHVRQKLQVYMEEKLSPDLRC